jgi:Lon protease-like protein
MTGPEQLLPLFPLSTVLFPGGKLPLKIFEARYLDMAAQCLRNQQPFGVLCLIEGREAGPNPQTVRFEAVGTLARIEQADAPQSGILRLACIGTQRFRLIDLPTQSASGLWSAPIERLPLDTPVAPPQSLHGTVVALQQAANWLHAQGLALMAQPWHLDDAGWVANRWSELLPLALSIRQQLLELDDPLARLVRVTQLMMQAGFPAGAGPGQEGPGPATLRH